MTTDSMSQEARDRLRERERNCIRRELQALSDDAESLRSKVKRYVERHGKHDDYVMQANVIAAAIAIRDAESSLP